MSDNEPAQILPEDETLRVNEWEAALTLVIGGTLTLVGLVGAFSGHGQYHHVPSWLGPVVGLLCIVGGIHIAATCRSGLIVNQDGSSSRARSDEGTGGGMKSSASSCLQQSMCPC